MGSRIARPKIPPQGLTDEQKDSIVRQIRSASAGRQGRESSVSALKKEKEQLAARADDLILRAEDQFESDKLTPLKQDELSGRELSVRIGRTDSSPDSRNGGVTYADSRKGVSNVPLHGGNRSDSESVSGPFDRHRDDRGVGGVGGQGRGGREGREGGGGREGRVESGPEVEDSIAKGRTPDSVQSQSDRRPKREEAHVVGERDNDDELKRMAKFEKMKEKKRLEAETRAQVRLRYYIPLSAHHPIFYTIFFNIPV